VSNNSDSHSVLELYNRGLELLRWHDVDGAKRDFESILKVDSEYTLAYFGMGCVYALQGFVDRAVEEWERSVEIDPGCGEAHYALAWAYYDGGDQERGYKHVSRAVESGVDLEAIKEIIEEFEKRVTGLEEIRSILFDVDDRGEEEEVYEAAVVSKVAERPVGIGVFQRISSFLGDKKRRPDYLCCLLIVIVCFGLLRGTLREGYPRAFLDGTMAYYLAKVKMLLSDFRFYTESWYFGFELLRFYPPLSAIIPYIAAVITGKPLLSYNILSFLFYILFCLGNYFFISRFLGSRPAGLFAGVIWALTHSNVVSFQGHYWEIARLGGSAALPWFLMFVDKAIKTGKKKWVMFGVCIASYTLLTNMYSAFDLALFALPFFVVRGMALPVETPPLRYSIGKRTRKIIGIGLIGVMSFTFWWYLPAVLPYGISGYFMGEKSTPPILQTILFQFRPPDWMPATQMPLTILGLLGLVLFFIRRDKHGYSFLAWFIVVVTSAYVIRIQSVRMLPLISLSLVFFGSYFVYGFVDTIPIISKKFTEIGRQSISSIITFLIIVFFLVQYLPIYSRYATVDDGYLVSDEYKTAIWLREQLGDNYRTYVMYGNRYRGAQWLNAITPEVKQVLGGMDGGAFMVDKTPFMFDSLVKNGEDSVDLHELAIEHNVKYIIIDDNYMSDLGPVYEKFFKDDFLPVIEINDELSYAKVIQVVGVEPISDPDIKYNYWDNWRIFGLIGSIIITFLFSREYKKIKL